MAFSILGIRLKNTTDIIKVDNNENIKLESLNSNVIEELLKSKDIIEEDKEDSVSSYSDSSVDSEYDTYSKVETHMGTSMSLYMLNRQGQDIIKELEQKKLKVKHESCNESKRKNAKLNSSYDTDTWYVYQNLISIINFNRMTIDLYVDLLNYLDEELFNECKNIESFYVKEDVYNLENLYYKQETWVHEIEWDELQVFTFFEGGKIDEGECVHLLMFCQKYMKLLAEISVTYCDSAKLQQTLIKMTDKLRDTTIILEKLLNDVIKE